MTICVHVHDYICTCVKFGSSFLEVTMQYAPCMIPCLSAETIRV